MGQKTQSDVKRWGHGSVGMRGELTIRCRTASPGRNLSWAETITRSPSAKPLSASVNVGFRTLDFTEALSGLAEGDRVIVSAQDKFRPGEAVRQRMVSSPLMPTEP